MPIRTDLWKVSATPQPLPEAQLASERHLEDMIVAAPKLLSDEWMLIGRAVRYRDFMVNTPDGEVRFSEVPRNGHYHQQFADDEEKSEYFVPVHWLQTIPASQAIQEIGMFGNQNTVCKPTTPKWRSTVERLKAHFPGANQ